MNNLQSHGIFPLETDCLDGGARRILAVNCNSVFVRKGIFRIKVAYLFFVRGGENVLLVVSFCYMISRVGANKSSFHFKFLFRGFLFLLLITCRMVYALLCCGLFFIVDGCDIPSVDEGFY